MVIDTIAQTEAVNYVVEPSPAKITRREVYIAIRNDGAAGSGTADDPYNGSTDLLLDPLLRDINRITEYMTVRFGPGVFQTKGNGPGNVLPWSPRNGQRLIGAGMYQTTIQLVVTDQPSGSSNVSPAITSSAVGITPPTTTKTV